MKYFSMFSGIGGFELGIGDLGECVGYSEIDKYAIKVYERNFNESEGNQQTESGLGDSERRVSKHDKGTTNGQQELDSNRKGHTNYGDATLINERELPDFDLLVGGFPCQAFSVAGKRAGFNDTRGTLFFEIARILKHKRPRHLVLENVKGLLSHDGGKTFQTILGVLSDIGYLVEWQVLNSKDFGVPQNRERVFIVGHLGDGCRPKVFPIRGSNQAIETHPCIDANYYKGYSNQRKMLRTDQQNTRTGGAESDSTNRIRRTSYTNGMRIRRLTPKECERLQGFPDDWTKFGVGDEPISDTQRYKMCGNAVTVNVVKAVIENLI